MDRAPWPVPSCPSGLMLSQATPNPAKETGILFVNCETFLVKLAKQEEVELGDSLYSREKFLNL
jgi:hypothetical protein